MKWGHITSIVSKLSKKQWNVVSIFISTLAFIVSIIAIMLSFSTERRNKKLSVPHFSVEESINENGDSVITISNSGGMFYNSTITAIPHICFSYEDDNDNLNEYKVYYSNFVKKIKYDSSISNGAFCITTLPLDEIEKLGENVDRIAEKRGSYVSYNTIEWYFVMRYNDYSGKSKKHIFKMVAIPEDDDIYNSDNIIMNRLIDYKESIPDPTIQDCFYDSKSNAKKIVDEILNPELDEEKDEE